MSQNQFVLVCCFVVGTTLLSSLSCIESGCLHGLPSLFLCQHCHLLVQVTTVFCFTGVVFTLQPATSMLIVLYTVVIVDNYNIIWCIVLNTDTKLILGQLFYFTAPFVGTLRSY